MSDFSTNLHLPYLASGQAQKHVTVNESLRRLDAVVQLVAVSANESAEPASPTDGALYILPSGKTGAAWGPMADQAVAYYRDGAWEEIAPREGWIAYITDGGVLLAYDGAGWAQLTAAQALQVNATDRVLGRAASGAGAAEEIAFTPAARALCDDASFSAMCATLGVWRVIAASALSVSHTGDTSETTLASVTIPGGVMGANGMVRVEAAFSYSGGAHAKTASIRFGGLSGAQLLSHSATTQGHGRYARTVANRNSASVQVFAAHNNAGGWGLAGGAPISTAAIDTANDVALLIRGQIANAGDTIALESYSVEAFFAA